MCRPDVLLLVLLHLLVAGCGKKGPPLPPLVRVPAAPEQLEVRRVGGTAYVTLTIPGQNVDASLPADVGRVEMFAVTGLAPPQPARFLDLASRVATIRVAASTGTEAPENGDPQPGAAVTVRDVLTPAALEPRPVPDAGEPDAGQEDGALPRRFYVAFAYSTRGRQGPPSAVAELPLTPLPAPPPQVTIEYGPDTLSLSWQPSAGVASRDRLTGPAPASDVPETMGARGAIRYNVYRVLEPDPAAAPQPQEDAAPVSINPAPIDGLAFAEPLQFDRRERCYVVRAVYGSPEYRVEGEGSEPACVTPVDTFPPAPPRGLSAVAAAGAVSLIWEPNEEADLAGYLILRGTAGDATLTPLTETPIRETRFTDRTVVPGVRYVYAIVALDDHAPEPNVSAESNRVQETAR